jgi:hypothetical protein
MSKNKSQKYKMVLITEPSKHKYTQEEIEQKIDKAIDILLNDLILNGYLKVEDYSTLNCSKINTSKK